MPTLTINGTEVTVPQGTNIVQAAEEAGVQIPYFCYHPGLSTPANCRMCLVEIEGARKLEPACYTKARDGMVVNTESQPVKSARKSVLEFILVNHPIDCPICDQAGECWLQDHYLKYNADASRVRTEKVAKVKVHPIGNDVIYDGERCILCTRCVRFCEEITQTSELTVVERGDNSEIRTFPGQKLDNPYSMCVADICPVGALTARPFRFKRRVWLLQSQASICAGCSRNCSTYVDHYQGAVERFIPRENLEVNEYWMCDAGRYSAVELNSDRITEITVDGTAYPHWPQALRRIADRISGGPDTTRKWALLLSPYASTESLAAAVKFAELSLSGARLFGGGKPEGFEDDFLIRGDKNPNSAGLELATESVELEELGSLVDAIEKGEVNSLYMMSSDIPVAQDDELYSWFQTVIERLDLFVLQSPWFGAYGAHADILLPAAAHTEQRGTFVNCDGIHQTVPAAVESPGDAIADYEIFLRLGRILKTPLPFSDWAGAAEFAGLSAEQINEPIKLNRENLAAPHGPHRTIPRRTATPHVSGVRTWWETTTRGTPQKQG